jgi:hypothetical protein
MKSDNVKFPFIFIVNVVPLVDAPVIAVDKALDDDTETELDETIC